MIRVSSSTPARKRPALANPFCGQACEPAAGEQAATGNGAGLQDGAPPAIEPRLPDRGVMPAVLPQMSLRSSRP
jgi:hypothetical protein